MKSETEIWIEKLEAAIARWEKLPAMSSPERRRIEMLMARAGRHDLMVRHIIPSDGSCVVWQGPLREFLELQGREKDRRSE